MVVRFLLRRAAKNEECPACRNACWYSWDAQTRSMEKLLDYDFERVLPGHGRIHRTSQAEMKKHLEDCVRWIKRLSINIQK
jgi:hypothetical protein